MANKMSELQGYLHTQMPHQQCLVEDRHFSWRDYLRLYLPNLSALPEFPEMSVHDTPLLEDGGYPTC